MKVLVAGKQIDEFEGLRIYTVISGTVQTPIKVTYTPRKPGVDKNEIYSFGRFENTRDIVQPAGRQAQQVGHVARMVEHYLILSEIAKLRGKKINSATVPYHPITGITKACRDSFELLHVKSLLEKAGILYFEFHDSQEDEYEDVVTALATVPVTPFVLAGILDYLPLWTGK
jgi:hypothetical protein